MEAVFPYTIEPLCRDRWQNHRLEFRYTSYNYYEVAISHLSDAAGFEVSFVKTAFDTPFVNPTDDIDKLFKPRHENVKAWGVIVEGNLVAAIETAIEDWSNRLRVTVLWVDEGYRRRGIATALMNKALERARAEKRRAVFLETQSCNEGAIDFYLRYGFTLIGFDAFAYRNNDLERKEVRMEFGIRLEECNR